MSSLPEGLPCMILLGHTISGMSKDGFLVSQEDDVISTDVAKKGELTHYRWCVSPSLCTCQAPVRIPLSFADCSPAYDLS